MPDLSADQPLALPNRRQVSSRRSLGIAILGIAAVFSAPRELFGQQASAQSSFQAESIQIARAVDSIQADSLRGRTAALATADSLLQQPVLFDSGSTEVSREARDLLYTKAWYLWFNPAIRLRLSGRPDNSLTGDDSLIQARKRIDAVRAVFRDRGISLDRIATDEGALDGQASGGSRVDFVVLGRPELLEIPPTGVDPPPLQAVPTALAPSGRLRNPWATVRIFFATDRARSGDTAAAGFYSGERAARNELEFGRIEVTIPRLHRPGVLEQPAWYRLERSPDPNRHLMVRLIQPEDGAAVFDSIRTTVATSRSKDALLFIHGYNVTFEAAALRTAQLAYDLGFQGVPILYSWPSEGSLFAYSADREAAEWSAQHLNLFLDSLVSITGAKRLHIVAHSMGNRALALALEQMAGPKRDTAFSNIVLAAPDLDAQRFDQQTAPRILPLVRRLTIYMSRNDKALAASRFLSHHLRLGEATHPILVVRGTDTIDASTAQTDFLGHGYFASNSNVIDDLILVVSQQKWPPRGRLRAAAAQGKPYWELP